jgi:hypothetical protein
LFADEPSGSNAERGETMGKLTPDFSASIHAPSDWLPTLTNATVWRRVQAIYRFLQLLYNNRRQVTYNDSTTSLLKPMNVTPF